jgi:hypothetical protein
MLPPRWDNAKCSQKAGDEGVGDEGRGPAHWAASGDIEGQRQGAALATS